MFSPQQRRASLVTFHGVCFLRKNSNATSNRKVLLYRVRISRIVSDPCSRCPTSASVSSRDCCQDDSQSSAHYGIDDRIWNHCRNSERHMDGPGCQPERGPGSNHQCRQGRPRVPDDAVSSEVRHILRAAKTICTNARRRTVTSQCNDYCRLERLTSASSEAAVSTNS
jgi:hypothetical protein